MTISIIPPLHQLMLSIWNKVAQVGLQTFVYLFGLTIFMGWYVVLIWSCVPCSLNNSYQKLLVKVGSQSDTIELSMSCSLKIWSMKNSEIEARVNECGKAQKWVYLESRSTTSIIIDLLLDLGRLIMKSMEKPIHIETCISRVLRILAYSLFPLGCIGIQHIQIKM